MRDPKAYAEARNLIRNKVPEMLERLGPAQIELIEIYRGASDLPAEFHDNNCAAIVIWTK